MTADDSNAATTRYGGEGESSPPIVRMMVLETDEPHPKSLERKGTYGENLHRHFKAAGDEHKPRLGIEADIRFVVTDKGGEVPKVSEFEGIDAVLLTGSMYDAHGDDDWIKDLMALLKELWETRPDMRFSGICFGHQLLCRLLGAEVRPSPSQDWELGHSQINLTVVGQRLFQTDDQVVHLHQMHQDHVAAPPTYSSANGLLAEDTQVAVWGSSSHTNVQGVYIPRRMFTVQAHLAFDEQMVKREMEMRIEQGAIEGKDRETAERAAETAHLDHDGDVVAAAILRFFHGDDDDDSDMEMGGKE
ncbi:hypothetical protein PpBr36_02338 [Pyricularia pennisetigena]|uniref:hypothetical protein n=1 Tax=Pyricularia pennisetigena TaxID=1578925 RepID=UPI00114DB2C5|nr:hypothetical protein PpBr36_02338 [Pyricularia pennisetigena]TLS31278.1 hypothetical protein PpBr36_02338 [Pyricularia pennisetigena]